MNMKLNRILDAETVKQLLEAKKVLEQKKIKLEKLMEEFALNLSYALDTTHFKAPACEECIKNCPFKLQVRRIHNNFCGKYETKI